MGPIGSMNLIGPFRHFGLPDEIGEGLWQKKPSAATDC
jgi:hypothetical protein